MIDLGPLAQQLAELLAESKAISLAALKDDGDLRTLSMGKLVHINQRLNRIVKRLKRADETANNEQKEVIADLLEDATNGVDTNSREFHIFDKYRRPKGV